jgi:phosphoenolpyruvate phosphomutase
MKAIILASGEGSRMGKLTQNIPKPLLNINGKSILEREISLLRKNGVNEIFVVMGYKKEKHVLKDIEYINDENFRERDQLSSLMSAKKEIRGDVIILFADIVFENIVLAKILESKSDISIAVDMDWEKSYATRTDNPKSLADKVLINQKKIIQVSAKDISVDIKNEAIGEFLGIIKLSANGSRIIIKKYEELEKSCVGKFHDADSFEKAKLVDILQELLDSKIEISPITITGKWCEIDTPQDLEMARKKFED